MYLDFGWHCYITWQKFQNTIFCYIETKVNWIEIIIKEVNKSTLLGQNKYIKV